MLTGGSEPVVSPVRLSPPSWEDGDSCLEELYMKWLLGSQYMREVFLIPCCLCVGVSCIALPEISLCIFKW